MYYVKRIMLALTISTCQICNTDKCCMIYNWIIFAHFGLPVIQDLLAIYTGRALAHATLLN